MFVLDHRERKVLLDPKELKDPQDPKGIKDSRGMRQILDTLGLREHKVRKDLLDLPDIREQSDIRARLSDILDPLELRDRLVFLVVQRIQDLQDFRVV
jgi:hypothetical protein